MDTVASIAVQTFGAFAAFAVLAIACVVYLAQQCRIKDGIIREKDEIIERNHDSYARELIASQRELYEVTKIMDKVTSYIKGGA